MKRLLLYGLILALIMVIPMERLDVAQLRPVEVIAVYQSGDAVILATDTDDMGIGTDAIAALENMRKTTPAVIYLDTAEYLLIGPGAETQVALLRNRLKDSVKLCKMSGNIDLKEAGKYLPVHGALCKLRHWTEGENLPYLVTENGRIKLLKNSKKGT